MTIYRLVAAMVWFGVMFAVCTVVVAVVLCAVVCAVAMGACMPGRTVRGQLRSLALNASEAVSRVKGLAR